MPDFARMRILYPAAAVLFTMASLLPLVSSTADAAVLPSQQNCQKSISKAARSYASAILKRGSQCRLAEFAAERVGECASAKNQSRLDKDAAKFDRKVRKGCADVTAEELSRARPFGLGFPANLDDLVATQTARYRELATALLDELYGTQLPSPTAPDRTALKCQKAINKAAAAQFKRVFRGVGSKCHDREDRGKDVTISRFDLTTACLDLAKNDLDQSALGFAAKTQKACGEILPAALTVCGDSAESRATTAEAVACLLDRTVEIGAALIESEHAVSRSDLTGVLRMGTERPVPVPDAEVQLRDAVGTVLSSATTNASGAFRLEAASFRKYSLCWVRGDVASCTDATVAGARDGARLEFIDLAAPLQDTEVLERGHVLRDADTACFDMVHLPAATTRGRVRLRDSFGEPTDTSARVSSTGEFFLFRDGSDTAFSILAECGQDSRVVTSSTNEYISVDFDNSRPVGNSVEIADLAGVPIADTSTLTAGDEVLLTADFVDDTSLTYYWEVTRGGGTLTSLHDATRGAASGRQMKWKLAINTSIQQVRVTATDARGGASSLIAAVGPFAIHGIPEPLDPCAWAWWWQPDLCGQGYIIDADNDGVNDVPEPVGGRGNFLSEKFGGDSVNNSDNACLYYNIIDPECVDLDCDGVVDPGTDPGGLCKRTTLGGWWEKNGFDTDTGLGTDVESAWYLNSNDLGFGREMHCRVTSYSYPYLTALEKLERRDSSDSSSQATSRPDAAALYLALSSPWVNPTDLTFLAFRWPSTIACYVANYTTDHCNNYPTNNPTNANLAYEGQLAIEANPNVNPLNAYGTVAMEFSAVEGFGELGPVTKFYVYGGRTADSGRINQADLDGCGDKSVPQICMACHGGNWPNTQSSDVSPILAGLASSNELSGIHPYTGATPAEALAFQTRTDLIENLTPGQNGFSSFLPFDPDTYQFPTLPYPDGAAQHDNLRALNRLVRYTEPNSQIVDLVKEWYGNNFSTGTFTNSMPSSSTMDPTLYAEVFATACRGCHAATFEVTPSTSRICVNGSGEGGGYVPAMPHAKLTYQNFWRSDFPQSAAQSHMDTLVPGFGDCRDP